MKKLALVLLAVAPGVLLGVLLAGCAPSGSTAVPESVVPGHSTPWSRAGVRSPGPRVATVTGSTVAPAAEPIELSRKWGDGSGDDYDDGEADATPEPAAEVSPELE